MNEQIVLQCYFFCKEKQITDLETQLAEETMLWAEIEEKLTTLQKTFKEYKELVGEHR